MANVSTLTEIVIGDTLEVDFTFLNGRTKLPENITGWILYWTFKPDFTMTDQHARTILQKIDLGVADPLNLKYKNFDPANGKVTLRLSPELTKKFILGKVYWDLQRVIPIYDSGSNLKDHDVITLEKNTATVVHHVTQTYLEGPLIV